MGRSLLCANGVLLLLAVILSLIPCCDDAQDVAVDDLEVVDGSDGAASAVDSSDGASIPPSSWSSDVHILDFVNEFTLQADISVGHPVGMLWAAKAACINAIEGPLFFDGRQVFYALGRAMPKLSTLEITLEPAPDVDLNLYAYQLPTTDYYVPPDVPALSSCVASYDAEGGANPGVMEAVTLTAATSAYHVVIAVSATSGTTQGGYTLSLKESGGL